MTDMIYAKPALIKPPDDLAVVARTNYVAPETIQRAWRAVNEFRKMLPTIQSFVRAITRDPNVIVQITSGVPCTDGRTVFLRPPIQLGDYIEHQRGVCGQRDENLQHLCPACTLREEILSTLFHECAHIVFDSFESISETERAQIILRVLNERPAISGTRLEKLQRLTGDLKNPSYVEVNNYISPYLPIIFNALEDARVNRAMYNSRAGTQIWFRASAIQVFEHGMELADGTIVKWSDMGANSQVIIGLFCRASGFETKGWFKDEIEEALNDRQLKTMIGSLRTASSAANVYRVGFPILERLRDLGFCTRLGEPCDDPPPAPPMPEGMPPIEPEGEQTEYASLGDSDDESLPEVTDETILAPEDRFEPPPGKGGDDSDSESDDSETGDTTPADASDGDDDADDADASDDTADDDLDGNKDDDKSGAGDQPDDDEDDDKSDSDESDSDDSGSGDSADVSDAESGDESGSGDGDTESDDSAESPDDVEAALAKFGGHAPGKPDSKAAEEEKAVDRAIVQAENFDAPSIGVLGVKVHKFNEVDERAALMGWNSDRLYRRSGGKDDSYWDAPEALLGKALFKVRKVFAYNLASRQERNLRHGRVHGPDAHRTAYGDKKVFSRTRIPGRRKYKVTIGLDISGSTSGHRIDIIKQAGMAMGELFSRTGVDFCMYAHTGAGISIGGEHKGGGYSDLMYADHFEVKAYGQPWGTKTRQALRQLTSASMNLDGHHLEFYRKLTERQDATDRLIIYFTDGEMPCENFNDELVILKREIETCRKLNIALLGVGIETDSPKDHGLDTVQIDTVDDIPKLIDEIESRLTKVRV